MRGGQMDWVQASYEESLIWRYGRVKNPPHPAPTMFPVDEPYTISQKFGVPNPIYDTGFHNGVDIAIPNGREVKCANRKPSSIYKTIEEIVGSSGTRGKGMWCVENEPDEQGRYLVTVYWHLQEFLATGTVQPGQVIALSNNTGQSSGPHLHWGAKYYKKDSNGNFYTINTDNGFQGYFDPMTLDSNMKYIMNEKGDQYILLDPLKVAIGIADVAELEEFKKHGLQEPLIAGEVPDTHMVIPGIRTARLVDLFNL